MLMRLSCPSKNINLFLHLKQECILTLAERSSLVMPLYAIASFLIFKEIMFSSPEMKIVCYQSERESKPRFSHSGPNILSIIDNNKDNVGLSDFSEHKNT